MIDEVSAGADEPAARPRSNRDRDVVEEHVAGGIANKAWKLEEGRPGGRRVRPLAVPGGRSWRRAGGGWRNGGAEVCRVPLHGAQRVLVIHMDVVEPLHLTALSVFDQ